MTATLLRASSGVISLILFYEADVLRTVDLHKGTLVSMGGWVAFCVFVLGWAWRGMQPGAALRQSGRIATLTVVSFGILYAYYLRSRLIETGPHTDAVFTYLGVQSFFELQNPITSVGRTPSFPQSAFMILSHAPGFAVGFDALGALAIPFGAIVHLALVLGVITELLVNGSLRAKAAVVALVSAMYSNRLLILTYDVTGYAFFGLCLGLMFLVLVAARTDEPNRAIGGFLALALLHHYPGLFMAAPLCVAWLILGRKPWQRIRRFVSDNPVVIAVVVMLLMTLVTNPELLVTRVKDVSVGTGGFDAFGGKLLANVAFLTTTFPAIRYGDFFVSTPGSWFLLNIPPLAGSLVPLVAGTWVISFWAAERRLRYLLLLVLFASGLGALTVLQHLLSDFSDYREFPFLFAMFVAGQAFVFRLPTLRWPWRALAAAYAIGFGLYNYVDLANLHGKTHLAETAHRSQAAMDALRRFVDERDAVRRLGAAKIFVVVDRFFPLEVLYLDVLRRDAGVPVATIQVAEACPQGRLWVEEVSRAACESFLLVANAKHCEIDGGSAAPDRNPRVRGYLYASVCGRPAAKAGDRAVVDVDLDGGRRS